MQTRRNDPLTARNRAYYGFGVGLYVDYLALPRLVELPIFPVRYYTELDLFRWFGHQVRQ